MKNNVLPFGIIAIVGIFAAIIVFYLGVSQKADIAKGEDGEVEEVEALTDPEEIYANQCASCHGDDLSGVSAPGLISVGAKLSESEIHDIIINGQGAMPGGLAKGEEAKILSEWLSEKKE